MYVPAKSVVTYQMKMQTSSVNPFQFGSLTDLEGALANDLVANTDGFTVTDYQVNTSGFFSSNPDQLTMKVKTGNSDYASEDDVRSIIDHWVYVETQQLPASTILSVQPPRATNPTNTGETQTPVDKGGGGGDSSSHWYDGIVTFLEGAGTGGILGVGVALVLLVLFVGLATQRKLLA